MTPHFTRRLFVAAALAAGVANAHAQSAGERFIVVASTTSTQDSGLFGHIVPLFKAASGIDVRVVSQGTGQALDTGRRGDADVVFVHARAQELKFVEDGFGLERKPVMYNDFVLIGPKADPAGVKGSSDMPRPFRRSSRSKRLSCRAETARARTRPNSRCGRRRASISIRREAPGIAKSDRAWALR